MNPLEKFKPNLVEKRWGSELWVANDALHNYCGKILHIKEGGSTSMHYHEKKHETFYVLKGTLKVEYIDTDDGKEKTVLLEEGESMKIPKLTPHNLSGKTCHLSGNSEVKFIESSTYHMDSDSYRVYL